MKKLNHIKVILFLCFGLSSILTVTPASAETGVFIDKIIGRYLPTFRLQMEPGAYKKLPIMGGNSDDVGGLLVIDFTEEKEFYGFSALICDEENAKKYEAREKAHCFRKEIDVKSDQLKYKFEGSEVYYLFIVNRTQPLRTNRDIIVQTYAYTNLTPVVRERLKEQITYIQNKLNAYFDTKPINYGVVSCDNKYVPSDPAKRTITLCSELILANNMIPDPDLLMNALFFQIIPILENDWRIDKVSNMYEQLQFMATMTFLFSETKDPFTKFLDLFEDVPQVYLIMKKFPQHEEELTYIDYYNKLIDISNDPFSSIDRWLNMAYENMNGDILEQIRKGELMHFGILRNAARLVLKRRYELKLERGKEEPKNIISDFW